MLLPFSGEGDTLLRLEDIINSEEQLDTDPGSLVSTDSTHQDFKNKEYSTTSDAKRQVRKFSRTICDNIFRILSYRIMGLCFCNFHVTIE